MSDIEAMIFVATYRRDVSEDALEKLRRDHLDFNWSCDLAHFHSVSSSLPSFPLYLSHLSSLMILILPMFGFREVQTFTPPSKST